MSNMQMKVKAAQEQADASTEEKAQEMQQTVRDLEAYVVTVRSVIDLTCDCSAQKRLAKAQAKVGDVESQLAELAAQRQSGMPRVVAGPFCLHGLR